MPDVPVETDEQLLDRFQRAAFFYFLEQVNPENGLVADNSRAGAPASIAVVGFALTSDFLSSKETDLALQTSV